jgi:guanine deaminase
MREPAKPDEKFMRLAVREARKNLKTMDGGPFGACVVKGGRVLAVARNTVLKRDATCHAEVNAIRLASRKIKNFDLSGCVIYSTNEPCPMCFGAIHWARIGAIIYGTGIKDAAKIGFNELNIPDKKMSSLGKAGVRIIPGFLLEECRALLKEWDRLENKKLY